MARLSQIFCLLALVVLAGCGTSSKPASGPVEKPRVEADLSFTTLTPDAYKSLGIVSEKARIEPVQAFIQTTGWIMAPPGRETTVTAPVAGYVRFAADRALQPGESLKANQDLFSLEPVLAAVEQIQVATLKRGVDGELNKAQATFKVSETELDRLRELHKQGLRGQQDLDQAQVRVDHAREDLQAAQDKQKLFINPHRTIVAPQGGTVLSVSVSPGQYVPAGASLLTAADLTKLWLRVPIAEHDLPSVAVKDAVKVALRTNPSKGDDKGLTATPVAMVPQVDTQRHTADLLYQLTDRPPVPLAKDQMVTAFVPLRHRQPETVVPYSALVFDAFGGSWLYLERPEEAGRHRFERRRVELGPAVEDGVIVRPGANADERIVTRGAGVLFSREFYKTPVRP